MIDLPPAYPLQWPAMTPRKTVRERARFSSNGSRLTVAGALTRLKDELSRLGRRYPVVSSNVELRHDGVPRSGQPEPRDPGVAVYFQLAGQPHCMPCDTYDRVADNIAAIAAHIEKTRAITRHGVASVEQMFAGFLALPSPEHERPWRETLGLHHEPHVSLTMVEEHYRRLARERHPDQGGSDAMMAELNHAHMAARREFQH